MNCIICGKVVERKTWNQKYCGNPLCKKYSFLADFLKTKGIKKFDTYIERSEVKDVRL